MVHDRTMRIATTSLALVLASGISWGDNVDDYLRAQMAKSHVPGAVLLVLKDGQRLKEGSYGLANVELNVKMSTEMVFQIGSMSKQFTASAIMLLVGEGKLNLDDPVGKFISIPDAWKGVTVRHLLTHTSGIRNWANLPGFKFTGTYNDNEFLSLFKDIPLDFSPGEKYFYSNSGYAVLGMIVHTVSGQSLEEFVKARFFDPIGMKNTRYNIETDVVTNRVAGYYWTKEGTMENGMPMRPKVSAPSGGILSTVNDIALWDAALRTSSPLTQAQKDAMWTPMTLNDGKKDNYGFGWMLTPYKGRKLVKHTGTTEAGFRSMIVRFQDEKLTIILLTNQAALDIDPVVFGIADFYLPQQLRVSSTVSERKAHAWNIPRNRPVVIDPRDRITSQVKQAGPFYIRDNPRRSRYVANR